MYTLFTILFFLFSPLTESTNEFPVRGKLLDCNYYPLKNAYISLIGQNIRLRLNTDRNGEFAFSVGKKGGYFLWLTGAHHKSLLIPLFVSGPLDLTVQLSPIEYCSEIDRVRILGDFNDFSDRKGLILMKKQPDGSFIAEVETDSDTLAYQLLGVQREGLPLSGTHADRYVID